MTFIDIFNPHLLVIKAFTFVQYEMEDPVEIARPSLAPNFFMNDHICDRLDSFSSIQCASFKFSGTGGFPLNVILNIETSSLL